MLALHCSCWMFDFGWCARVLQIDLTSNYDGRLGYVVVSAMPQSQLCRKLVGEVSQLYMIIVSNIYSTMMYNAMTLKHKLYLLETDNNST